MEGYLGEQIVDQKGTPYEDFGPYEWAFLYLDSYDGIDGSHHKQWVIDQCRRILKGTPVILKIARWDNGEQEYRFTTGEPSEAYKQWAKEVKDAGYEVDVGIAP